ncbi:MAG: peptide chain release factor N(5)-glutamine methyltransferase [Planctomycetes bacterium]|nr:peptide chain release factor N(5)-glutamine methyltransferase [Planctomycetota bacterium]MBI3833357.1 peptide chain release factor N(5)-glutamine methyltransferase [Planctomycetota bacterium]
MAQIPQTDESRWTIGRLLSWTSDYLKQCEIEDARLSAEVLLAAAMQCRRIDLYTRFDEVPGDGVLKQYRDWVRRAAQHEPIAYLVGEKEFFSLPFHVSRDVLIPRPETEALVEAVADYCQQAKFERPRILDVGTGSGCIIIAILKGLPAATGVASDISAAALEIARKNAHRHQVVGRLQLIEADGLSFGAKDGGGPPSAKFDVIVSNPPYIPAAEVASLKPEVREFEPPIALTDGSDGLSFYRHLATDAPDVLTPNGHLFVEVADGRAAAVIETVSSTCPKLVHRKSIRDRVTGLERVIVFGLKE